MIQSIKAPHSSLPLASHVLFQTHDVDEARECVAKIFCPHTLRTFSQDSAFDARHHSATVHKNVSLNYVQYGAGVDIEPGYLESFYLLQIPLRGEAEIRCGSQRITAHNRMASLPSPTEKLSMRWRSDSPHFIVRISKLALQVQYEKLAQTELKTSLVFDLGVSLNSQKTAPIFNFVSYLQATIQAKQSLNDGISDVFIAQEAESFFINMLLTLAQHNHSNVLQTVSTLNLKLPSLKPRIVRRAQDLLNSLIKEPTSLADLCQQLGVSARSLQVAFKEHTGQSPMTFLRNLRLDKIHHYLKHESLPRQLKISDIAAQYGFFHHGHFADYYKNRFGHLPMQTRSDLKVTAE